MVVKNMLKRVICNASGLRQHAQERLEIEKYTNKAYKPPVPLWKVNFFNSLAIKFSADENIMPKLNDEI